MKILVLTKRQYTNKDLIDDQYGRLWEIPLQLAESGHQLKGICLSYRRKKEDKAICHSSSGGCIEWNSYNLLPGFLSYIFRLVQVFRHFKPDVIWVSSDCLHIIMGVFLGKIVRIPCAVDLYDNYEFFGLSSIPGVVPLYRFSLKKADAISCISKPLLHWVRNTYKPEGKLRVIENAVNIEFFFPREKASCRNHFKLPQQAAIIGTAGALESSRGIDNLYRAFLTLVQQNKQLHLAVAGVGERDHTVFRHPNVHDLGILAYVDVPVLFNALDVAVICNQDNKFGRFCFPQKAWEILACKTPVIAADIGAMSDLFREYPECLFNPGDPEDLAERIKGQFVAPSDIRIPASTWKQQAEKLEQLLAALV